jgi:hypothetical protein
MSECAMCGGNGFVVSYTNDPTGGREWTHCPSCGGRGTGAARGAAPAAPSSLGFVFGLGLLVAPIALPVAALLIATTWWPAGPIRWLLELLAPESVVVRQPDQVGGGRPLLVVVPFAVATLLALIVIGVGLRRTANAAALGRSTQLRARLWGLLWATVLIGSLSLLLPLWGVAVGGDLTPGVLEEQSRFTQWWQIAVVVLVTVLVASLRSGLALRRAGRRAARRGHLPV